MTTKYYTVIRGHNPGIYDNWRDCKKQTHGYSDALFKSYATRGEAEAAYANQAIKGVKRTASPVRVFPRYEDKSISVDASCLGNPGQMEFQGVITGNSRKVFGSEIYPLGTNNLGEFLALVKAIMYLDSKQYDYPIYTDSEIAISWVRNKRVKTTLVKNEDTAQLHEHIAIALEYLQTTNFKYDIRKWETRLWGESKADFDRK